MNIAIQRGGDDEALIQQLAAAKDRTAAAARCRELTTQRIATSGRGLSLAEARLSSLDLHDFDLRQCTLNRAELHGTNLSGANLQGASLICPGMERTNLSMANLSGAYVHALAAQAANMNGANLLGLIDATGSLFHGCMMRNVRATNAVLAGSTFYQCDLQGTDFRNANLQGVTVNECILEEVDFSNALVSQLTVTKCQMRNSRFTGASGRGVTLQRSTCSDGLNLDRGDFPALRCDQIIGVDICGVSMSAPGADFQACSLRNVDFREANLARSRWLGCTLEESRLDFTKLEDAFFSGCQMPNVVMVHARAENVHFVQSQLPHADMQGFEGRCASFRDCNLGHADLTKAYLYRAMLTGDPPRAMNLRNTKLVGAVLTQSYIAAELDHASLRGAIAVYARLNQCSMKNADLSGVNVFQASMVKVDFTGASLAGVAGPIFVSRCPGLREALQSSNESSCGELSVFVGDMEKLLNMAKPGST